MEGRIRISSKRLIKGISNYPKRTKIAIPVTQRSIRLRRRRLRNFRADILSNVPQYYQDVSLHERSKASRSRNKLITINTQRFIPKILSSLKHISSSSRSLAQVLLTVVSRKRKDNFCSSNFKNSSYIVNPLPYTHNIMIKSKRITDFLLLRLVRRHSPRRTVYICRSLGCS